MQIPFLYILQMAYTCQGIFKGEALFSDFVEDHGCGDAPNFNRDTTNEAKCHADYLNGLLFRRRSATSAASRNSAKQ
jgi:hypothetical protein